MADGQAGVQDDRLKCDLGWPHVPSPVLDLELTWCSPLTGALPRAGSRVPRDDPFLAMSFEPEVAARGEASAAKATGQGEVAPWEEPAEQRRSYLPSCHHHREVTGP